MAAIAYHNTTYKNKGKAALRRLGHITGKRQLTIPKDIFERLGLGRIVQLIVEDEKLIVMPFKATDEAWDPSEQILEELIAKGYNGEALMKEFRAKKIELQATIDRMIEEVENIADGDPERGERLIRELLTNEDEEAKVNG